MNCCYVGHRGQVEIAHFYWFLVETIENKISVKLIDSAIPLIFVASFCFKGSFKSIIYVVSKSAIFDPLPLVVFFILCSKSSLWLPPSPLPKWHSVWTAPNCKLLLNIMWKFAGGNEIKMLLQKCFHSKVWTVNFSPDPLIFMSLFWVGGKKQG